jgi:hypothetical protein
VGAPDHAVKLKVSKKLEVVLSRKARVTRHHVDFDDFHLPAIVHVLVVLPFTSSSLNLV